MNRLLWALLTVSILFSAWGLFLDKAIAADRDPAIAAQQEVLPVNSAWGGQRAIGVVTRPEGEEDRSKLLQPAYDSSSTSESTPSYSSEESSDD